jgi:amphi-Trp domain-containing protein
MAKKKAAKTGRKTAKKAAKKSAKKTAKRTSKKAAKKKGRDIEKAYTTAQTVEKLRRLADSLEAGRAFRIQVAGERIYIPADTMFNIEHEREGKHEEVEFQFKWVNA